MNIDIQNEIKKCEYCQKRKVQTQRTKESFIPRISNNPFEQIVIDFDEMSLTFKRQIFNGYH